MCWMRMRSAPPGCSGTPLTEIGPVPARDRSYSAPRSVHFRLEIGPVPRRDRSNSAPRSVHFRAEVAVCQDIRDRASASGAVIRWSASWGWGSYESGRTAAGRLCRCSRGPGVVGCEHLKSTHVNPHTHACRGRSIVAHSRALRVDGNREIMRNSNTGNGRGRAPMCADPPHRTWEPNHHT